jgi:hypothetical protein
MAVLDLDKARAELAVEQQEQAEWLVGRFGRVRQLAGWEEEGEGVRRLVAKSIGEISLRTRGGKEGEIGLKARGLPRSLSSTSTPRALTSALAFSAASATALASRAEPQREGRRSLGGQLPLGTREKSLKEQANRSLTSRIVPKSAFRD